MERENYPRLRIALYGKRNEYWEQSKLLLKEARGDEVVAAVEIDTPLQEPVAISARAVEQLSTPTSQEKPMSPEIAEFLRNQVIDQDLSYQDAILSEGVKRQALEWSRNSESAQKYADSLMQLSQRINLNKLRAIARELVEVMNTEAARIGIPVTPYGRSNTWAMWDIGKQNYFFMHQEENDPAYEIGDVLTSETKREEIINRHVGWEAYAAFRGNTAPEWKQNIMSDRRFDKALDILNRPPKQKGTLSSKDLAALGRALREAR